MAPLGAIGGPQEMTKVSLPIESAVKFATALDTANRVSECAHVITNDTLNSLSSLVLKLNTFVSRVANLFLDLIL